MFRSKRQQEILESTESKLAKMFEEMNTEKRPDNGRTVWRDGMHHGAYPLVFRLYVSDEGAPASDCVLLCGGGAFPAYAGGVLVHGVASGRGIRGAFPCLRNASA